MSSTTRNEHDASSPVDEDSQTASATLTATLEQTELDGDGFSAADTADGSTTAALLPVPQPDALRGASTAERTPDEGRSLFQEIIDQERRFATRYRLELTATAAFFGWVVLFFGGAFLPATEYIGHSIKYLDHVVAGGPLPVGTTVVGLFGAGLFATLGLFFWTWTNLPMMCVMAASLGEIGRGWRRDEDPPVLRTALTTGFVVYSLVLVDELVTGGDLIKPDNTAAQATYVRLAVLSSLFSYMAALRPTFLESLYDRLGRSGVGRGLGGSAESKPDQAVESPGEQTSASSHTGFGMKAESAQVHDDLDMQKSNKPR